MGKLKDVSKVGKPIIGMVHLRPFPGFPKYDPVNMGMDKIIPIVLEEAVTLEQAGVDGAQVESMQDIPHLRSEDIGYETVAALAVGIHTVHNKVSIPVGVECHTNGVDCVMACAVVAGASRIRVLGWCNVFVSQSGFINAMGASVPRMRSRLKADQILVLRDMNVKHGSHYIIHDRSVAEQATDIESQDSDAVTVTGFDTGTPPSMENISKYKKSTPLPTLIGSGLNSSNVNELLTVADGAIIGNWLKEENNWKNPVSYDRTKELMDKVIALRQAQKGYDTSDTQ